MKANNVQPLTIQQMHFLFILPMDYSIQGHISYILEANSKRAIREKRIRKRCKVMLKKWNELIFFLSNKNI